MKLELVPWDHALLRTKLDPFDFTSDVDVPALVRDMSDVMIQRGGAGLAANQLGLPHRMFVIWSSPAVAIFNPTITDSSTETVLLEEACLSFPHLAITVRRPRAVRVRYQTAAGEMVVRRFEGLTARVFQHEFDHINGELFFRNAGRPKLEAAIKRAKKHGVNYTLSGLMKGRT